uniref:Uncharacterized protein n=1 Tax=Anopheles quadriannulatus TaxID=34691 RepID=A0A182XGP1_ANOQN
MAMRGVMMLFFQVLILCFQAKRTALESNHLRQGLVKQYESYFAEYKCVPSSSGGGSSSSVLHN